MGREGIRPVQSVAEQALMFKLSGSSQPYGSFGGVSGFLVVSFVLIPFRILV